MNYNQIHPNKKRVKRIRRRLTNDCVYALIAMQSAIGANQISVLNATPHTDKSEKQKRVFQMTLNTANAIIESLDQPRQSKFKKTGWYGLKKGEARQRKEAKEAAALAYRLSDDYYENMMFSGSK